MVGSDESALVDDAQGVDGRRRHHVHDPNGVAGERGGEPPEVGVHVEQIAVPAGLPELVDEGLVESETPPPQFGVPEEGLRCHLVYAAATDPRRHRRQPIRPLLQLPAGSFAQVRHLRQGGYASLHLRVPDEEGSLSQAL